MPLTKSQFAPYDLYDNLTLENFVRGLATQKAQVHRSNLRCATLLNRIDNRPWMQTWQQNWQIISSSKMMKSLGLTWYSIIIYTDTFSPLGQRVENEKTIINVKVSLNIQRGRDHGLAPYTRFEHPRLGVVHIKFSKHFPCFSWRKLCGLSPVTSWKMLAKIFPQNIVPRLQAIYDKVEDVDLFVGGLLESAEEVWSFPNWTTT